jgi:hypothetical protein
MNNPGTKEAVEIEATHEAANEAAIPVVETVEEICTINPRISGRTTF